LAAPQGVAKPTIQSPFLKAERRRGHGSLPRAVWLYRKLGATRLGIGVGG